MLTKSTKERINISAITLFVNKGIKETSIRDIVLEVGLTEGAFYRHYKSKDELVIKLFLEPYLKLTGEIEQVLVQNGYFEQKLARLIRFLCESIDNEPILFQYLLITQHNYLKYIPPNAKTSFAIVEDFFQKSIDDNSCKIQDPTFAATVFFGIIIQSFTSRIYKKIDKTMMKDYENILQVMKDAMIK
ncbi:MAG: hypothetical protein BGO43_08795 [Gammaproteobacteria bacterium 39-13]|nr:TetR/AcrR family transcriptional regulator [Gammaproteobacteria bacterium]OJV94340.1 MAG: hypothetical protein BGO43_08795 [Gammaproteobacteria bacterium 39-13]